MVGFVLIVADVRNWQCVSPLLPEAGEVLLAVRGRDRDVPSSGQITVRIVEEAKQVQVQTTGQPQHNEQVNGSVKAVEEARPIHEQGGK